MVNATGLLFDADDVVLASPKHPVITASEDDLTSVAGVALWGPLLDRLNVVAEADRWGLRPIGPGGYSGGQCYRAVTEILLAGGDFLSDRALIADPASGVLRGGNALPSVPTLWRFFAGADLGRVMKAAAVNRVMGRRAWAVGAAPAGDRLTIDPDATRVATYGCGKEGSAFSRSGQTALSPLVGVCGETGDVLALRARGGAANDGRAMGSFIDECVAAIPAGCRGTYRLWLRVDSAGYQQQVIEAAERHHADFSVTAKQYRPVQALIHALAVGPDTVWAPAAGHETDKGSQIAETTTTLLGRGVRLIVRRQPKQCGDQLAFDDLDGWRLHAIITNVTADRMSAAEVEAHHRLRGGIPEDTIRALKNDFGMIHAPCNRSSVTGCTGRPPPWRTTSGCGCAPWRCPARSVERGENDCAWHFSTSPPDWCVTADARTCALPPPTPTSRRSPTRYDTSGRYRPSVERREPARQRKPRTASRTLHRHNAIGHA